MYLYHGSVQAAKIKAVRAIVGLVRVSREKRRHLAQCRRKFASVRSIYEITFQAGSMWEWRRIGVFWIPTILTVENRVRYGVELARLMRFQRTYPLPPAS